MMQSSDSPSTADGSGGSESAVSLKHRLLLFAKFIGLFALARVLTSRKTRVLAYHGIWLGDGHFGNFLYMSADKFASRMALLEKWGYPVVPFEGRPSAKSQHRCPTVITIDDGWYSTWLAMLPALERHKYPATIYLTTYYCFRQAPVIDVALSYCISTLDLSKPVTVQLSDYNFGPILVDSEAAKKEALSTAQSICASLPDDVARQLFLEAICGGVNIDYRKLVDGRWFHLMNPEEVRDAASRGVAFEAHTHHHRITHQGKDTLADELELNSERILELTGAKPKHFCYPSGRFTSEAWPVLEECEMASSTTTDIGLVDEKTPLYAMPRILDGQDVSELEFEAEMSGFMELSRLFRRVGKR